MNNLSDWLNMNFCFSLSLSLARVYREKKEEGGRGRGREIVLNFAARQRERERGEEERRGANEQDIHHRARRERVFRFPPLSSSSSSLARWPGCLLSRT